MKRAKMMFVVSLITGCIVCAYEIGFVRGGLGVQMEESVGLIRNGLVEYQLLKAKNYRRLEDTIKVEMESGTYGYEKSRSAILSHGLTASCERGDLSSEIDTANAIVHSSDSPSMPTNGKGNAGHDKE